MYQALLQRDHEYDGLFYFAVRTTGIFCRPTCTAKKPLRRNVRFFESAAEAIAQGFRPCRRCRPLELAGGMPAWLEQVASAAEADLERRWSDADIRSRGVDPTRVRRWFLRNHGVTFHNYLRARRLSAAVARLADGEDPTRVAFDTGYESVSGFRDAFANCFGMTPGAARNGGRVLMINRILTPLGPMIAAADGSALYLLEFVDRRTLARQFSGLRDRLGCGFCIGENAILERARRETEQYFAGGRRQFTVPIDFPGTDFQQAVWRQLREIAYGQTTTYEAIAKRIGRDRAVRAVGRANGDNRLALVVPCHRVVGRNGRLTGYAGGLRRKEWLLAHERSVGQNESGTAAS
jgi:AraC family transcriptional regulator, regulatory protein of adaptative response / methylated-DNA-[protein]-cysteine methyltransferase